MTHNMTLTANLSVIFAVVGLLLYGLPAPAKVNEVGRILMFVGLLAWLVWRR